MGDGSTNEPADPPVGAAPGPAAPGPATRVGEAAAPVRIDVDAEVARIASTVPGDAPLGSVEVDGHGGIASAYDVSGLLVSAAAHLAVAADDLARVRGISTPPRRLDADHVRSYATSHVEVDGRPIPAWADLSGVYEARDGRHLQLHCNFEHHAAGIVRLLGCEPDRESLAGAVGRHDAHELEARSIAEGMIAAVVRTTAEWDDHPHAAATRDLPLVSVERIGDAAPLDDREHEPLDAPGPLDALSGLRVLDCSRVIAGPVAGQLLAALGADVLRVGADHLPSVDVGVLSTGSGKRSTSIDLRTVDGRSAMGDLLGGADVWIDAYRPGALAGHGFTPEGAARGRPGIVIVQISAFDVVGPWAGRRGFDSIVQSTTGIRLAGGEHARDADGAATGSGPLGLPVQALDHATGTLAAGVAAQLLAHQRRAGGSWLARLSLLRTRDELVRRGAPRPYVPSGVEVDRRVTTTCASEFGEVTTVDPFVGAWRSAPRRLGTSPPRWAR
ncbi:CoA transferase [Ilumatobacter sp.]|uniref:CoA transferase n=1 Tax=Ilumatobacter sp. TaxID=1967498 RepID=UPI003B52CC8D